MIEVNDLLLDTWELYQSGMNRKEIALKMNISYSYVGLMISEIDSKAVPRCQVNITCRLKYATWWYWTMNKRPILTDLRLDKPHRTAVPCCDSCARKIWKAL